MLGLNLDPSGSVPITLRAGKSFGFTITFEENITPSEWEFVFSSDKAGIDLRLVLTNGHGFTASGKVITVFVSQSQNTLIEEETWFRGSQTVGDVSTLAFFGEVNVRP